MRNRDPHTHMSITCIIPSHNDSEYLIQLIAKLSQIQRVQSIVVVDDGSHPKLKSIHPEIITMKKVLLLSLNRNLGKSTAVKQAISITQSENVLLLDADIEKIDHIQLSKNIETFLQSGLDMLLMPSTAFYVFNRISRHNILFTGIRILKSYDLKKIFMEENPTNYQLEVAINRYMLRHKKKVKFMYIQSLHTLKAGKIGVFRSTIENIKMLWSILNYSGLSYIKQVLFFAHDKIPTATQ